MTRVDFYILAERSRGDRFLLTCRLLEKIHGQGRRVYVNTAGDAEGRHLDRLLWTYRQQSFLPHGLVGEADPHLNPILIGWEPPPEEEHDVLVNLAAQVPSFFSRFERVAEPIDREPAVRQAGRDRYRFYRDRGYPLETHDIKI